MSMMKLWEELGSSLSWRDRAEIKPAKWSRVEQFSIKQISGVILAWRMSCSHRVAQFASHYQLRESSVRRRPLKSWVRLELVGTNWQLVVVCQIDSADREIHSAALFFNAPIERVPVVAWPYPVRRCPTKSSSLHKAIALLLLLLVLRRDCLQLEETSSPSWRPERALDAAARTRREDSRAYMGDKMPLRFGSKPQSELEMNIKACGLSRRESEAAFARRHGDTQSDRAAQMVRVE